MAKKKKPKKGGGKPDNKKLKNEANEKRGREKDQCTLRMIDEFAQPKDQSIGITIPEVAEHFKVSQGTVYRHLGEIAKRNGRESSTLLSVPYSKYEHGKVDNKQKLASVDADTLIQRTNEITLQINAAREEIAATIKGIDEMEGLL